MYSAIFLLQSVSYVSYSEHPIHPVESKKQGGKESPSLLNMMMKSIFVVLQESWRRNGYMVWSSRFRRRDMMGKKVTHFTSADSCYCVSSSRMNLGEMMMEATVSLGSRGFGTEERGDGIYSVESW